MRPDRSSAPCDQRHPKSDGTHIVRLLNIRAWMWFTFVFFTAMAVLSWRTGMYWVAALHSLFAVVGAVAVVGLGSYRIEADRVWMATPVGRYGMRWDEVQAIEFDGMGIVFHGDQKRFVMLGPGMWSEQERRSTLPLLDEIIKRRNIPYRSSHRAGFTFTKNARMK